MKESTGEWNGTLLSLVMRVGSVCMRVMDVHMYGIDLVSIIFQSAFAHDIQSPTQASWCGGPSFTTLCLCSTCKIAQVVNHVLLPFLQYEGDVLFYQDNAYPHMAAATQCTLCGVQLPWPARSPALSPIEHVWDMMKWELTLSPETATTIAELR